MLGMTKKLSTRKDFVRKIDQQGNYSAQILINEEFNLTKQLKIPADIFVCRLADIDTHRAAIAAKNYGLISQEDPTEGLGWSEF